MPLSPQEIMKKLHPKEYQVSSMFKRAFQSSPHCLKFREAWKIPIKGLGNEQEYATWYGSLIQETNEYYQSERYRGVQEKIKEKRKEVYEGKITDNELKFFASQKWLLVPLHKFDYDVDQTTLASGRPVYWRDFIERCLLFEEFDIFPVRKPVLQARLYWDNYSQSNDIKIENIFPDTTTKDFDNPEFVKKLKELQTKLPGYTKKQTRIKKNFEFGQRLLKLDAERPGLSDIQKVEEIDGPVNSVNWGEEERRLAKKAKQTRYQLKKYLEDFRSH